MSQLNNDLLTFFTDHYKPGAVGLVGTNDALGLAIREAQSSVTGDRKSSRWSHCFIIGELRPDKRGTGNTVTKSPHIFESDLKVKIFEPQLRNGAQESWIGKWCTDHVEYAAVIDFGLSGEEVEDVLASALQLVDEQVMYPIQELLGTWLAIVTSRQWKENPLDDPHAMYCSAFVRYCYKDAAKDFLGGDISISNTTPEDIGRAGSERGSVAVYKT